LAFIAADQNRIGHHAVAVLERHASLRPNGDNRANEMLVHAHAAGDAVHDDAETLLSHVILQMSEIRCQMSDSRKCRWPEHSVLLVSDLRHLTSVIRIPAAGRCGEYIRRTECAS